MWYCLKNALPRTITHSSKSSHSRGSTVDLTLLDMKTGKEVDMGSPFDMFSEISHPDYKGITEEQYENRMELRNAMIRNGFEPIDCEWWHYTLRDEPFPDTYFEFPVSSEYLSPSRLSAAQGDLQWKERTRAKT